MKDLQKRREEERRKEKRREEKRRKEKRREEKRRKEKRREEKRREEKKSHPGRILGEALGGFQEGSRRALGGFWGPGGSMGDLESPLGSRGLQGSRRLQGAPGCSFQ